MQISEETLYQWYLSVVIYGYIFIKGIIAERTPITAALSGTVILQCTKPEQKDAVIWMHNQNIIFLGSQNYKSDSDRFQLLTKYQNDNSLMISGIKNSDEGQYTCKTREQNIETYMLTIQDTENESRPLTVRITDSGSQSTITDSNSQPTLTNRTTVSALTTTTTTTLISTAFSPESQTNISHKSQSNKGEKTSPITMIFQTTVSNAPTPISATTKDSTPLSSSATDRQRNNGAKHRHCVMKIVLFVSIIINLF